MMPIKRRINWDKTPYQDPFYDPVPVPDADPMEAPTRCFQVNHEYIPYLLGAVNRLTRSDAWRGDDAAKQAGVNKAHTLIAILQDQNCPEGLPDGLCTDFMPENPFITYFPMNPFTTPEVVPPGYANPPFYSNSTDIIQNIVPTDVMVNLLSLDPSATLPDLIGFSFPHIHIELSGQGTCMLKLKKIIQGGFVTITIDGNPLQARVVNLASASILDFSSILAVLGILFGGTLGQHHLEEIEFTTAGDHTIDIVFYPNVGGSVILGFGGGLSEVSFCDESIEGDIPEMAVTDVRFNALTCALEVEYNDDGEYIPIKEYYPLDATCKAENFHARGDTTGLRLYDDEDVEKLALEIIASNDNRLDTQGSRFAILFGAGATSNRQMWFNADGTVQLVNAVVESRAKLEVYGENSAFSTMRLEGRTGQAADTAVLHIGAINQSSALADGDAIFIRGINDSNYTLGADGIFRIDKFGRVVHGTQRLMRTLSTPTPRVFKNSMFELGRFAYESGSEYRSEIDWYAGDEGGFPEASLTISINEDRKPMISFLNAEPRPKQFVTGNAEGNELVFQLAAAMATFGLIDTTGVTLGISCCDEGEACIEYNFMLDDWTDVWEVLDGIYIPGSGYGQDGVTLVTRLFLAYPVVVDTQRIEVFGSAVAAIAGVPIRLAEGEGSTPFHEVGLTPSPLMFTSITFGTPYPGYTGLYIEIEPPGEQDFFLERIVIHYALSSGDPPSGNPCE